VTIDEILAEMGRRWAADGFGRGPSLTEADVAAFEARHGRGLPADARAYFLALNGFAGCAAMDEELLTFWNLSRVRPLSEEAPSLNVPDAESYFVFVDYLIWSHAYALRLHPGENPTAEVVFVDDGRPVVVAGSLTEFLEGYLRSDFAMFFPERPQRPVVPPRRPSLIERLRRVFIRGGEVEPRLRNRAALTRELTKWASKYVRDNPGVRRRHTAVVVLQVRVDPRGRPDQVEVTSPCAIPALNEAAARAGWRMKFRPARIDRNPVHVLVSLPVTFQLGRWGY
jgi:TonB family protein